MRFEDIGEILALVWFIDLLSLWILPEYFLVTRFSYLVVGCVGIPLLSMLD